VADAARRHRRAPDPPQHRPDRLGLRAVTAGRWLTHPIAEQELT